MAQEFEVIVFYADDEFSSKLFDDFDKQDSITHRLALKKTPDEKHQNLLMDVSKFKGPG